MAGRKDNRYYAWARIAPGPKGRVAQYGKTQEEADAKARALESATKELATPPPAPTWPVGSFAAFVYEEWMPHVYPHIRATTIRSYDSILRHHVLPALGHFPIASVGYREVQAAIDGMQRVDENGALPARRKNEATMRIKEILNFYAALQSAKGTPARTDWSLVKPPKRKRRKDRPEPPEDFTAKILGACVGRFAWAKGPVFAALFLGLRRGEVAGLMWSDIDREALTINVSEQRQREYKDGRAPTKGEGRVIPVPAALLDRLDKLGNKESVFVFTGARGTPVPVDEISKVAPRLCEAAGLPPVTFHDLRSFAASNLADLGVDLPVIMEILGHSKLDVTMLYVNRKNAAKRKALEALLEKLTG
jgi:integrase